MSVSFSCHCEERQKFPEERNWGVIYRNWNPNAGRFSRYSTMLCFSCGCAGRSKAWWVSKYPNVILKDGQWAKETK